jgi:hypothetical protein
MAMKLTRQSEWPRVKREPDYCLVTPDGYMRSDRAVAGPLRPGTVNNSVGPRGRAPQDQSTYGMDHITREFDPVGSSLRRYPNDKWTMDLIGNNPAPRNDGRSSRSGPSSSRETRGSKPGGGRGEKKNAED